MIKGAHIIIYSKDPAADRVFFRDILNFDNIDVGDGWLLFALPPTELAMHPVMQNEAHELHLVCEDVHQVREHLTNHHIACSEIQEEMWGSVVRVTLPGGSTLGIYQSKHALVHESL